METKNRQVGMEKGIILLNGAPFTEPIDAEGAYVVCCDGALRWAEGNVRIDVKAGDFDSLGFVPEGAAVYPAEKDFTDGEIALQILFARGCRTIEIYGGSGGREDHWFGNLQLLYAAHRRGAEASMISRYTKIECKSGEIVWLQKAGRTVSLAPVGMQAHILESEGLKYPLRDLTLTAGSCRGISNVIQKPYARVCCDRGALFIFEVREEAKW